MNDQEFLMWIHERLEHVHHENPLFDYMHRLRAIIAKTPADRHSKRSPISNSLEELKNTLGIK